MQAETVNATVDGELEPAPVELELRGEHVLGRPVDAGLPVPVPCPAVETDIEEVRLGAHHVVVVHRKGRYRTDLRRHGPQRFAHGDGARMVDQGGGQGGKVQGVGGGGQLGAIAAEMVVDEAGVSEEILAEFWQLYKNRSEATPPL
jgi:hypothetical protein